MHEGVPRDSLMPEQLLSWTDATQLKLYDNKVALKAEQDSGAMLSTAIDLAKLSQESTFQMGRNRILWKQNRAACKARLAARRALLPAQNVPCLTAKVYPIKNARGGPNKEKVCTICGECKKGTHGRLQADCPTLGYSRGK